MVLLLHIGNSNSVTVAEKDKKFRSPALDTDESYSYTFTTPGTYAYFCTLHAQMVAMIIVSAAR